MASGGDDNDDGAVTKNQQQLRLVLPTADDTEEVGALLASALLFFDGHDSEEGEGEEGENRTARFTIFNSSSSGRGYAILLDGDLGAGKTAFSRGFVRAATGDWQRRVTSPTYLLSNTYPVTLGVGDDERATTTIE